MGSGIIRRRLLYSLVLMAGLVVAVSLPLSDRLIDREFGGFIADKADGEADRLELLMQERIDRLRSHAVDYGDWGATVGYVDGRNPGYLAENLYPAVLGNFDVDYVFVADRALQLRYAAATPDYVARPGRSELVPMLPSRIAPILADPRVRRLLQRPDGIGLLLRMQGRWFMIGAASISNPGGAADRPVYGVLGFVAELGPARQAQIRKLAGVPFSLDPPDARDPPFQLAHGDVQMHRRLHGSDGAVMAVLDIRYPRPLARQIAAMRRVLLLTCLAIFAIGGALVWLLVDRGLLSRLEQLNAQLRQISSGDRALLPVSRRDDEVDHLAGGINHLHAELSRLTAEWRHEALHDPLTGMGNRAQLLERLAAALAAPGPQRRIALLLIDLDGFKTVNDMFGHHVGDQVLRHVGERIAVTLPSGARCFRLGGDEFAVLAEPLDAVGAKALAHMINATIRADDSIGPAHMLLSASIGVACHRPDERTLAPAELLQRADIALYAIKRGARNGFAVFDDSMLEGLQRDNLTLRLLREALQAGRIDVWFQPIVCARTGETQSFEALARWRDDTLGDVPPMRFVALAEENSLGSTLDRKVLEKAVAGLVELRTVSPTVALSVNASVQSLLDPAYVSALPQVLARAGLGGDALRLEITESALAANEEILVRQLEILRNHDVRIELDDFGTGHSSLGRLAKLHPRGIKLDRSFVRDRREGGDRVCRAIIGLGRQLDVDVIAEGVETENDLAFLRDAGCDAMQGYYFAKPMPLADAMAWLKQRMA